MTLSSPVLDCRSWEVPVNQWTLDFALREFEADHGRDPEAIVMRPEQHAAIKNPWEVWMEPGLFIQHLVYGPHGKSAHFQMIPITLEKT